MSLSAIQISPSNEGILVTHVNTQQALSLKTWCWATAKVMMLVALIFPCMTQGAAEIHINDEIYYVSKNQIQQMLHSSSSCDNENDLKSIALSYFNRMQEPATLQSEEISRSLLTALHGAQKNSGYHVHLTRSTLNDLSISIDLIGRNDEDIVAPRLSAMRDCQCCQTKFEHTFKTTSNNLCVELSTLIERFDMFAIFSPNGTLLLVPDTRKAHVLPSDFYHLFQLDAPKMEKLISAILLTEASLHTRFPSYQTRVTFHVGVDGSQTVPIIHARFEGLPHQARI